jgi:hypothetical protein
MPFWHCTNVVVAGGLFTRLLMLALGLLFMIGSLLPGLKIRGALSRREGTPATPVSRIILLFIGCVVTFDATRLLFLCD